MAWKFKCWIFSGNFKQNVFENHLYSSYRFACFSLVMRCTAFSISSRIILAYAKVEFHCISRFATVGYCLHIVHSRPTDDGAWESEQRLRGAACLAKLRWIEIQTRCIERALTSSGNCAFLHSQFRLIATRLYAWKIGVWKILHLHER